LAPDNSDPERARAHKSMTVKDSARVRESLRAGQLRITEPRRVILETVRQTDRHPTAAWIHRRVRRRLPRVSVGTVYRNLRLLAQAGLVVERPAAEGSRFEGNLSAHHHFTCDRCHRIYDLAEPADCTVQARIAPTAGFEVVRHRAEFYGHCSRCRSSRIRSTPRARRAPPTARRK
jgi:Fur family peroxide stress response transcriptional regulator